jgi:hypothetical protein
LRNIIGGANADAIAAAGLVSDPSGTCAWRRMLNTKGGFLVNFGVALAPDSPHLSIGMFTPSGRIRRKEG